MKLTNEAMLRAIRGRDPRADGRFIYGVVTTGVCCRPVCRSRAPRPENLRFFGTLAAARAAGFRPCKRCQPDREVASSDRQVLQAARFLLAHPDETASLATLAQHVHWSPAHLQRRFRRLLGVSPREFQEAARLGRLKALLRAQGEIGRALLDAGFDTASKAYRAAQRGLAMTPASYRAGAAGEIIHARAAQSSLGVVLLAVSQRGVCFAQFGRSENELRSELQREFPAARFEEPIPRAAEQRLERYLAELLRRIEGGPSATQVPLDLRGTVLQVRVWRELQRIAVGDTRSYAELANKVHKPRAVRAVASACANNRIAVLVPCHRVVRGNGELAGYRWGLKRKKSLLANERA